MINNFLYYNVIYILSEKQIGTSLALGSFSGLEPSYSLFNLSGSEAFAWTSELSVHAKNKIKKQRGENES